MLQLESWLLLAGTAPLLLLTLAVIVRPSPSHARPAERLVRLRPHAPAAASHRSPHGTDPPDP